MSLPIRLKSVLIGVVVFLVLLVTVPLILALFVDKEFNVEREITIERPLETVFDYIRYVRNHQNFAVWNEMDPDMQINFQGTDGEVGLIYSWHGNEEVGRGEQETTAVYENERIEYVLRFFEPFESEADAFFTTSAVGENRTRVTWGFSSEMPYPMNLLMLVFDLEENIGKDYDKGLEKLKAILESEEFDENEPEETES